MRLLVLLLLLSTAFTEAAEINLRSEATITGGSLIRLGEVATVTGANADRVARTPLMPSPAPGTRQFVSAGAIRDMLAAQGFAAGENQFRGAYRIQITSQPNLEPKAPAADWRSATPNSTAPRTAFRVRASGTPQAAPSRSVRSTPIRQTDMKLIEQSVIAALQAVIDQREISSDRQRLAVRGVELSATAIRELTELRGQQLTGHFANLVNLSAGSRQARIWPESRLDGEPFLVVADLVEQPMRVVARSPLGRGALITASAIRVEPVPLNEIGRRNSTGFAKIHEVVGKETTRRVNAGELFSDMNTAPPMMVRRGEEVTVVSGGGGVSVRVRALAKQDGRTGDLIQIELLGRGEELMARVVGPRRLAILSAGPAVAELTSEGGLR